jgi:hypothetical protein
MTYAATPVEQLACWRLGLGFELRTPVAERPERNPPEPRNTLADSTRSAAMPHGVPARTPRRSARATGARPPSRPPNLQIDRREQIASAIRRNKRARNQRLRAIDGYRIKIPCSENCFPCFLLKIPCSDVQGIASKVPEFSGHFYITMLATVRLFVIFPVFFPVSREFGDGDRFDRDCLHHHAVLRKQRFPSLLRIGPNCRGFVERKKP